MTFGRPHEKIASSYPLLGVRGFKAGPRSMTKRPSGTDPAPGRIEFGDELQQPLTAACNYIGAARLLVASDPKTRDRAIGNLDNAEIQILRAGEMIRRIQARNF